MPFLALLCFALIVIILIAAGRTVLSWVGLPRTAGILEKNLIGYAIGLVVFAYGMLVIGLLGKLYASVALAWLAGLLLVGGSQYAAMAREAGGVLGSCFHPPRLVWLMIGVIAFFDAVSLIGCFTPPVISLPVLGYTEWDSISYHLADPKLYIAAHRIYPIWWEHHSNFAFTGEMWYTFGLLMHSVPLAKLFHWSCGLAGSLAIYRVGMRFVGLRAAALAVILFASTPLVFWEAGTAYVDLIPTYFGTTALLAIAAGTAERDDVWLRLAAVLMGLTLASKATAVITLALFSVGLFYWRMTRTTPESSTSPTPRSVLTLHSSLFTLHWAAIALLVGSPWYVKSIAYTGNPVYPFFYHLFGGRYWNAQDADAYDFGNAGFGLGHQPTNLLLAPWNLIVYLMPGHPAQDYPFLGHGNTGGEPFNNYPTVLATLSPVLLAVLFVPCLLKLPTAPRSVKWLALFALGSFVLWFSQMQYVRYLLPVLPVFCILAGWVLDASLVVKAYAGRALAVLTCVSVLFAGYAGVTLAAAQLPVVVGTVSADYYVEQGYAAYSAMVYINNTLPPGSKVVFYDCPFGYYCDKPYLWGDKTHSAYIPYDSMHSAADLLRFFQSIHVTHVLVGANASAFPWPPPAHDLPWVEWVYQLTGGESDPVFSDNHGDLIYALPVHVPGG